MAMLRVGESMMKPANGTMHRVATWILPLLMALPAAAQQAGGKGPDIAELAKAGRATLKRLESQAASWTATTRLAGGTRVVVDVVATPAMRRSVLSLEAQGRRAEVFRLITRDGAWYATEGPKAGKYRPYEAPSDLPTTYFYLARSEPRCIAQAEGADLGAYEGTEGGVATYRTSLAEPMRKQLQGMLDQYEEVKRRNPEQSAKPEVAESLNRLRDLLEKGIPIKIQVATGMLVQSGTAERQTDLHDFRWLDRVPADAFNVEGRRWEDFTDDPTEGGTSELLVIGHSGIWRPGVKSHDTDGRLLDLRTGRYRRIPFQGATCLSGCFLKGRSRVVVLGSDALEGVMGLYEVDLKTGENRQLGGELLASGSSLMPVLSPDGNRLAVLHKGASGGILDVQVCLVDLKTGDARPLGKPHDVAFPSWLPDGKGLLLLARERINPSDPAGAKTDAIARMGMDGRLTKIREGSSPVLLNDGATILFQDTKTHTWQTCGLDGGDAKPFAGGLAGHGFPSPAPDGKRILMMRFRPDAAPEPLVLPIGKDQGKPAATAPGLWAMPAWR
jgi:hypothetical protein